MHSHSACVLPLRVSLPTKTNLCCVLSESAAVPNKKTSHLRIVSHTYMASSAFYSVLKKQNCFYIQTLLELTLILNKRWHLTLRHNSYGRITNRTTQTRHHAGNRKLLTAIQKHRYSYKAFWDIVFKRKRKRKKSCFLMQNSLARKGKKQQHKQHCASSRGKHFEQRRGTWAESEWVIKVVSALLSYNADCHGDGRPPSRPVSTPRAPAHPQRSNNNNMRQQQTQHINRADPVCIDVANAT